MEAGELKHLFKVAFDYSPTRQQVSKRVESASTQKKFFARRANWKTNLLNNRPLY
jgi:hypothetical protein